MATNGIDIPSPSVFLRPNTPLPIVPASEDQQLRHPTKHVRRPYKTKAATATATATATVSRTSVAHDQASKPKQSKSRNGCSTCKAKRLKCDEEKPGCQQCAKRKVECGGYKKDFKWRPFEETNVKINIDRPKKATSPPLTTSSSSQHQSPVDEAIFSAPPEISRAKARRIEKTTHTGPVAQSAARVQQPATSPTIVNAHPVIQRTDPDIPSHDSSGLVLSTVLSAESSSVKPDDSISADSHKLSPTLSELLMPFSNESHRLDDHFAQYQLPGDFDLGPIDELVFDTLLASPALSDGVEELQRSDDGQESNGSAWTAFSNQYDLSILPFDFGSQVMCGPLDYLYTQPTFAPDSAEMLSLRFDRLTCGILSVMDGPTENPWRVLIWPLTQQSPALYHAVTAMTAFHSSTDVPTLRLTGHEHKQASIRYIQEDIRNNSMTDQTAIATALALGFTESWDQHTASGNTHIKGAQALVKRALADHKKNPLQGQELARLKFLCNAWVYMDVIARLTAVDSDESNDFDNTYIFSKGNANGIEDDLAQPSGFGIDFGMPIDARLDPLMGCASTLFPLIGRVANLVKKVFRTQSNSPAVISQANDLKLSLEIWEPPAYIEPPEDPSSQVQHTLQTAEAYRWATLLHLHQSVPELPSLHSSELGQKVLSYLATVPLSSRTVIVQIYPLMVAGCEAATAEDRQWVRDRWAAMNERMRIGVIEKCATVAEEVWRRKDLYEAQPTQHRKLVATADLRLARLGSDRLKRPHSGFQDVAPGRNGIVFSWAEGEAEDLNNRPRRGTARTNIGSLDPAYTVRGPLHWVGVMYDWGWEVLLG